MYCIHCEVDFNPKSQRKRRVGGRINECADCVEELGTETAVKYLGFGSGDGEACDIAIVAFENDTVRDAASTAWKDGIREKN